MSRFAGRSKKRWTTEDLDNTVGRLYGNGKKAPAPRNPGVTSHPIVILCRDAGLPEPQPEYTFHPVRKWRFDYAWPEHKLALEVEGGLWMKGGGGHSHPMHIKRDMEKYNAAARFGWRVLRYVPEEIADAIPDLREIFADVETREMA